MGRRKGSKRVDGKLTELERRFCHYYVIAENASEAAKKAGYSSASNAYKAEAVRMMKRSDVLDYIASLRGIITISGLEGLSDPIRRDIEGACPEMDEKMAELPFVIPKYDPKDHVNANAGKVMLANILTHTIRADVLDAFADPAEIVDIDGGSLRVKDFSEIPRHARTRILGVKKCEYGVEVKFQDPSKARDRLYKLAQALIPKQISVEVSPKKLDEDTGEYVDNDGVVHKKGGTSLAFFDAVMAELAGGE